jgi:hypothetical protein
MPGHDFSRQEILLISALGTVIHARITQLESFLTEGLATISEIGELEELRTDYEKWKADYGDFAIPMTMEISVESVSVDITAVKSSPGLT